MKLGNDDLGDRMKFYESVESDRRFLPMLPVMARLDGRSFSVFTKHFERPYDQRMIDLMGDVTKRLVEETQATIGYTQSDEISLVYYSDNYKSQIFFDGRVAKMTSVLSSMVTYYFNNYLKGYFPEKVGHPAFFDCRVWQLPTLEEAANTICWREIDATKNSVSSAARVYYSHRQMMHQGRADMMEMLMKVNVNWNDYPSEFKRGSYYQKRVIKRKFSTCEIEKLPPQHAARSNPDLEIERFEVRKLNLPPILSVANRVGVIIFGEDAVPM